MTLIASNEKFAGVPAARRSWADIVKGKSASNAEKPLKPAEKGSHRVVCTGEFLVMLGHYGWIMSLQNIDHPDAERHGGRIYIRKDDLRPGAMPKPHEEVTFFLYCDKDGLGAEDCFVTGNPYPEVQGEPTPQSKRKVAQSWPLPHTKERVSSCEISTLRADAVEFVPPQLVPKDSNLQTMNPDAQEFVPVQPGTMNGHAEEFVPMTRTSSLLTRRGMDVFAINTKQFRDDDECSDDTESTVSDLSARMSGSLRHSPGQPEHWSSVASRCAKAVDFTDDDASSWCSNSDDEDDDAASPSVSRGPVEWFSVATRCAEAVGQLDQFYSWQMRNAAATTKMKADVGDDIRWDVILDAMAEMEEDEEIPAAAVSFSPPPGLCPPGLAPTGTAPPGL